MDEGGLELTFLEYREAFLRALAARDAGRVVTMIQPELRNRSFVEFLRLSPQEIAGREEAWVWRELERTISHGGAFTTSEGAVHGRREFCAPYAYVRYPRASPLLSEMGEAYPWVVIGRNVAVRRSPSIKAAVIARVSYELLPVDDRDARDESGGPIVWQGVYLPNGRYGFIADDLLWGDRDYHACFANFDGQWLLTKFERGL
ncbi:MAG: hypothetical protein H0W08_27500 [Acidobacteria bacterium]|nr:hypothetical protein [Acidobacteriota bacterium]